MTQPDFLLTLTQASLDKFGANTSEDALIMIDKSLLEPDDLGSYNVVSLPILHTATRVVGKPMTANIVAVGANQRTARHRPGGHAARSGEDAHTQGDGRDQHAGPHRGHEAGRVGEVGGDAAVRRTA